MKTRRPPHPQQESDQLATPKVQTRSWGQGAGERSQPQPVAYDLSQVDLFSHAPQRPSVQTKLAIALPTEKHRQEGERVAQQVVNMPDTATPQAVQKAGISKEATIQRVVMDPHGNKLVSSLPKPPELKPGQEDKRTTLEKEQDARRTTLESSPDVYVLLDQVTYENHILNNTPEEVKHLKIKEIDYTTHLSEAVKRAENRAGLVPMKARASVKGGVMVNDNAEFNQLTPAQLPHFSPGVAIYPSQKHNQYKTRKTPAVTSNWDLTLHQQTPGNPVAFNFRRDDLSTPSTTAKDLHQTLFQYDEGVKQKPKKRFMAGLAGQGAKKKWNPENETTKGTTKLTRRGEKRKYNNLAKDMHLVQGHGQDYDMSMKVFGEYDASHNTKADDIVPAAKNKKNKKRKLNSDYHPSNFSSENPTFGEHMRNSILENAQTNHSGGSIREITTYHQHRLDIDAPKGMNPPPVPHTKELTIFDEKGIAKYQYKIPQFHATANQGEFEAEDYSQKAATAHPTKKVPKSSKKKKKGSDNEITMTDVLGAYKVDDTSMDAGNPSYVDATTTTGLNDPNIQPGDLPPVQSMLGRKNKIYLFFKESDFV